MSDVYVGIDLEQFIGDPHATGIQRVLQYLGREWPKDIPAAFVIPVEGQLAIVTPQAAAQLVDRAFDERSSDDDLAVRIDAFVQEIEHEPLSRPVTDVFSHWLLPEVSYLPTVLDRARAMQQKGSLTMIGYDALPMTDPANYRFIPGHAAEISEYFRLLAQAQHVVAISDYSRTSIGTALRRSLPTDVAHPGGDHVPIVDGRPPATCRFLRVGTLEARKKPVEIIEAFEAATDQGMSAQLTFIGRPSASDEAINQRIRSAIANEFPVEWIAGAPDSAVHEAMNTSTYFLSVGIEGYGIPVLESIRLGTPVLFGGTQPAAELMRGHGAAPIEWETKDQLASSLATAAGEAPPQPDPTAVPTWRDFVARVTEVAIRPPLA
jgi:hypothetical protein